MKTRNGFVSNSSSSSFLVMYNDFGAFDFLKESRGYETFIRDMNNDENKTDDRIREYLCEEYSHILNSYRWYCDRKKRGRLLSFDKNPLLEFSGVVHRIHADGEEVKGVIDEGVALSDGVAGTDVFMDWEKESQLAQKFADILLKDARKNWKHISVFEYSDDDGVGYMEHEFMSGYLVDGERDGFEEFAVVVLNEH